MRRGDARELAPSVSGSRLPEAQLLLTCARVHLDDWQRATLLELCAAGIDWPVLIALGERHNVVSLLHRHLNGEAAPFVPKAVMASLWARHEAIGARNRAMADALAGMVAILSRHGIRVVPYKGPTLAIEAYGDLGLREFGDLDLLVRADDAIRIRELLCAEGFVAELDLSPEAERLLVLSRRHYELPMRHDARKLLVELHWRSDPEFEVAQPGDEAWWSGLRTCDVAGTSLPAMSSRELLLVLFLHGTKHFWSSLGWLVDVAELMRRTSLADWDWIVATARRLGAARHLGVGVSLASDLLQAQLPDAALALVADREVAACVRRIQAGLFDPVYRPWTLGQSLRQNLRLHEGWRRRVRYLLWTGLTPGLGEWQRFPLPRSLFFLYWPLRPLRLAEKYLFKRTPPAAKPRTPPPPPRSTG